MELVSDKDIWSLEQWVNGINNIYMKDIHNWCRLHFVKYHTVFVYRKEYPVKSKYLEWVFIYKVADGADDEFGIR